jgi:hypothetical protein
MASLMLSVVLLIAQLQNVLSKDIGSAETTSYHALSNTYTFEGSGLRGRIQPLTQSLKSSNQFGVQQANTVVYNGRTYSTLADMPVTGSSINCQENFIAMPSGWSLAPDNGDSQTVIGMYPWSTSVVVVAGGQGYGTTTFVAGAWHRGLLVQSGDSYKASDCAVEILIYEIGPPTTSPTERPTEAPTEAPTLAPTSEPTEVPTEAPTLAPSEVPTEVPTEVPSEMPSEVPSEMPSELPTEMPTLAPTSPTHAPTAKQGTMAFDYRRGTALTASNFNCMKNNGFSHFIPRAYTTSTSASGVDRNICHHLTLAAVQNLHSKGVFVSAKPAYGLSAREPLREVKKTLLEDCGTYSDVRVWIQVLENGQDNYGWLSDTSANQAWFEQLLTSCKNHFTHCGVMASQNAWATVFGSSTYHNADVFSGLPLWYSNTGSRANYADFGGESVTIGVWSNADMKQYDAVDMCDVQVGLDWAK